MARQGLSEIRAALENSITTIGGAASFQHTFVEDINDGDRDYPYVVFVPTKSWNKLNPRDPRWRYQEIRLYWFELNQDGSGQTANQIERSELWDSIEEKLEKSIADFLSATGKWQALDQVDFEYDYGELGARDDVVTIKAVFNIRSLKC